MIPTVHAEHLAQKIQTPSIRVAYPGLNKDGRRVFPDGELYVKIPGANRFIGKKVVVLHSGAPSPNEGLIELELILQILKEVKPKVIEVFFAYFPYGMQDSVYKKGETNVAESLVGKLIQYYRVRNVYIIDAHFAGKEWVRRYPIHFLTAVPLLQEAAAKDFGSQLLFLSPDKGGARRTNIQGTNKKRKTSYEVEINGSQGLVKKMENRVIAVVDDLIETGGTLDRFYHECRKADAKATIALATHGVLEEGIARVKAKYQKLYLCNTIDRKAANVDITPLILQTLLV